MQLAEAYANKSLDEVKAALAGATLRIYSCPQPENADKPIIRNGLLAECVISSIDGDQATVAEEPVLAKNVGTPLFSRATTPDGAVIGDFSTGPGDSDIKLAEVSCSKGAPVKITKFQVRVAENGVMPVSPRDKMVEKFDLTQISHEKEYAWNADFASRKTA
ncbi:hypothetical protein [Beijerinckia mobilis]|uniref:hypothetical protein n=1 Tax=Beijerinckia mobilis TaxID=231434 RepID=UPI0005516CF5|nr:hypothetical protein [Beijerinckia mobilis]